MFEHYMFGIPALSREESDSGCVGPLDMSFPSPVSPSSKLMPSQSKSASQPSEFTSLVSALESSELETEDDISTSYLGSLPSPPTDFAHLYLELDPDLQMGDEVKTELPRPSSLTASLKCRRLQRQHNAKLQCESSTLGKISNLVEEMVSCGSQCTVKQPPLTYATSPPSPLSPSDHQIPVPEESEVLEAMQKLPEPAYPLHSPPQERYPDIDFREPDVPANMADEGFFEDESAEAYDDLDLELDLDFHTTFAVHFTRPNPTFGIRKYTRLRRSANENSKPRVKKMITRRRHD